MANLKEFGITNPQTGYKLIEAGKAAALVGAILLVRKFGFPLAEKYIAKKKEERKEKGRNSGAAKANGWMNRILESECPANFVDGFKTPENGKNGQFIPDGF